MTKFEETLQKVSGKIKEMMTEKDISDERLEKLTGLNNDLKELGTQHQEVADKCLQYREKYIESITSFGTTKNPQDDVESGAEKTFEQVASEIIAKGIK